jgi:intracellular sulfur oxidation DsrE/DsrF family protein
MRGLGALVGTAFGLFACVSMLAAPPAQGQQLRIDVPVVLKEARVVLNLDRHAFEGDEPKGLRLLNDMIASFKRNQTKARIVAIFHGESGYMLLDDAAYERVRNWRGGNPYKQQIAALVREGVEIEECGHTMAVLGWSNAELLPDVKVNTGANFRILQLVQEGFVQLQP